MEVTSSRVAHASNGKSETSGASQASSSSGGVTRSRCAVGNWAAFDTSIKAEEESLVTTSTSSVASNCFSAIEREGTRSSAHASRG
jgi:hypothetical protein